MTRPQNAANRSTKRSNALIYNDISGGERGNRSTTHVADFYRFSCQHGISAPSKIPTLAPRSRRLLAISPASAPDAGQLANSQLADFCTGHRTLPFIPCPPIRATAHPRWHPTHFPAAPPSAGSSPAARARRTPAGTRRRRWDCRYRTAYSCPRASCSGSTGTSLNALETSPASDDRRACLGTLEDICRELRVGLHP